MGEKVQVGAMIDRDLWRKVRVRAAETDRSAGDVLREAVEQYLGIIQAEPAAADVSEAERIILANPETNARDVARILNDKGLATSRGRSWTINTVNKTRARLRKGGA